MKKTFIKFYLSAVLFFPTILGAVFITPHQVFAQTSGAPIDCGSSNDYDKDTGLCIPKAPYNASDKSFAKTSTLMQLVTKLIDALLMLVGVIAVVFIIIGGYQYVTAGGNEEQAEKGRKALTNAVIGLVVVLLSFAIIQIVTRSITQGLL